MDEMRKAFEAFMERDNRNLIINEVGEYMFETDTAFAAWQAATLAEREACAAICDEAAKFHAEHGNMPAAIVDQNRAEDIRSRTE